MKRGTWKLVLRDEVPKDANVMGGRFVLAIKDADTDKPTYKARFVVQGHRDRDKDLLVHTSSALRQNSLKILVSIAAMFGFPIWTHDVSQAYLQSGSQLLRDVYVKPTKEFELTPNVLFKLLRPLYGLPDAGDYWHMKFANHLRDDLHMRDTIGDLSLFFHHTRGKLDGILGTYIDDSLIAGTPTVETLTDKTLRKFESRERIRDNLKFAGISIETTSNGFKLHQCRQANRLSPINGDSHYTIFRSALASLAWFTHTNPRICCDVAQLAQTTQQSFDVQAIKRLNKIIRSAKESADRGLMFQKVDVNSVRITAYSDGAFANNPDESSQLGYLILLSDKGGRCNVLAYKSFKSRIVVCSVLGGEILAFSEAFDRSFIMKRDLEAILNRTIPMVMLTDSKSLFDVLVKNSTTLERRLMIDFKAARDAYNSKEISNIGFIRSHCNAADAFTKAKGCEALERILSHWIIDQQAEQWVIRNEKDSHLRKEKE